MTKFLAVLILLCSPLIAQENVEIPFEVVHFDGNSLTTKYSLYRKNKIGDHGAKTKFGGVGSDTLFTPSIRISSYRGARIVIEGYIDKTEIASFKVGMQRTLNHTYTWYSAESSKPDDERHITNLSDRQSRRSIFFKETFDVERGWWRIVIRTYGDIAEDQQYLRRITVTIYEN